MKTPLFLLSSFLVACGSSEPASITSGAAGDGAPAGISVPKGSLDGGLTIKQQTGPDAGKSLPLAGAAQPGESAPGGARLVMPEGWIEEAPESPMRYKQYALPGPEGSGPALAVVAHWPNGVGGLEINLDRWVKQVGGEKPAAELSATERWTTESDRFFATHVHVEGSIQPMEGMAKTIQAIDAGAILAAFVEPNTTNGVWTIKITGPSKTVAAHKERYAAFVAGL